MDVLDVRKIFDRPKSIVIMLISTVSITVSMVVITVARITIDGRLRHQENIRQARQTLT